MDNNSNTLKRPHSSLSNGVNPEKLFDTVSQAEESLHKNVTSDRQNSRDETVLAAQKKANNKIDITNQYMRPPPYKPTDFVGQRKAPNMIPLPQQKTSEFTFYQLEDNVFNRRGFRYYSGEPAEFMKATMYRRVDLRPSRPRIDYSDLSPHAFIDSSALVVTSNSGYRSARANVFFREKTYFFEIKAHVAGGANHLNGHVRMGLSRRESSLETPVGSDAYSYGIRDVMGQKVHCSRPQAFMDIDIESGDVIGFEISLPSLTEHRRIVDAFYPEVKPNKYNIIRDRFPIRYKNKLYFEMAEYASAKAAEELSSPISDNFNSNAKPKNKFAVLPGSYIKIYKNGKPMGKAFENLYAFLPPCSQLSGKKKEPFIDDGTLGYYPTISVYRGGVAEFNFGPEFSYPVNSGEDHEILPAYKRWTDQICEEVLYHIIDEICVDESIASFDEEVKVLSPSRSTKSTIGKLATDSTQSFHPDDTGSMTIDESYI